MLEQKELENIIGSYLDGTDMFLIDIKIKPVNRIHVFIDGDKDISIQDCVDLSRHIEASIDREKEDFELNVSSAGVDYPLKYKRQYRKNIGRTIDILLNDGSRKKGKLINVFDDGLEIEAVRPGKKKTKAETEKAVLQFNDIKETKVKVAF